MLWFIPYTADMRQATARLLAGAAIFTNMCALVVGWRSITLARLANSWPMHARIWRRIKNDGLHHHGGGVYCRRLRRSQSSVQCRVRTG